MVRRVYIAAHREDEIVYPTKLSEFEVQAILYNKIREKLKQFTGFDIRGEVISKNKRSRFDLVLFFEMQAVCIIEVKDTRPIFINKNTRQFKKYSNFKVPLIYCYTIDDVAPIVNKLFKAVYETRLADISYIAV